MQHRALGGSGLTVAPLAFGGNVFGWTADEATSLRLLDAFVDDGFNLVDTADVYSRWVKGHSGGESETVIGRWLKQSGKRHRVVLATKVGMDLGDGKVGLGPKYIRQAVDASLCRLQVDHIDLYQAHEDDPKTPLEETLGAFADLIRAGKVRAIGASNYSAARLSEALSTSARLRLPRYESLQPLYNLMERPAYEAELEAVCRREGLGVINYFGLASGFLTGKYQQDVKPPSGARMGSGNPFSDRTLRLLTAKQQNWDTLDAVRDIAAAIGATPQSGRPQLGDEPTVGDGSHHRGEQPRTAGREPGRRRPRTRRRLDCASRRRQRPHPRRLPLRALRGEAARPLRRLQRASHP